MLSISNAKERGDKMQKQESGQIFAMEERELMDICGGEIRKSDWETGDALLQWLGKLFGYESNE